MSKYHAVSSGMVTRQALPSITRQRGTTTGSANLMLYGAGKTTVSNNTTFIDSSANAFTVTRNGDTVQSGFNPFSQASSGAGYFDGNGDYLTVPANAAFNFGTGNFTVEAWIYITGNAALNGNGVREATVFNVGSTAFTTGFSLSIVGNSTTTGTGLGIYKNLNTETSISAITTITQNAWHHIAVTRSGSSVYLFLDGTQVGSTGTSSTIWGSTTEGVLVGRLWSGTTYLNDFPGYISNARVVKGTAVYTSNFTPPTSPLTAITNTSLLLLTDNYSIVNSTATNLPVTLGNTSISTAQFPTGMSSSMLFNGTTSTASVTGLNLSSVNWTIEGFVYFTSFTTTTSPHIFNFGTNVNNRYVVLRNGSGKFNFTTANSGVYVGSDGTTTASTGVWYHFAAVRNGSSTYLYINGTLEATVTSAINSGTTWYFGGQGFSSVASDYLNGYLSNVRICSGTALYTANFTPPSAPLSTTVTVPNYVTNNIYGMNQIP
jgi:hypothetical protein